MPKPSLDSSQLAHYMEQTGSEFKPWLLVQLRLLKLQERQTELSQDEYLQELAEIHHDLMALGEWWQGQEAEVFGINREPLE